MTIKKSITTVTCVVAMILAFSCNSVDKKLNNATIIKEQSKLKAKDILGNPNYPAISYGGYRAKSRTIQPTLPELKRDMKLLYAMGIRIIRTYNVQPELPHASNILKAIDDLKK